MIPPEKVGRLTSPQIRLPARAPPAYNAGMGELTAAFGVAFAAFWVWLVVRIINRREPWVIGAGVLVSTVSVILATLAFLLWTRIGC